MAKGKAKKPGRGSSKGGGGGIPPWQYAAAAAVVAAVALLFFGDDAGVEVAVQGGSQASSVSADAEKKMYRDLAIRVPRPQGVSPVFAPVGGQQAIFCHFSSLMMHFACHVCI